LRQPEYPGWQLEVVGLAVVTGTTGATSRSTLGAEGVVLVTTAASTGGYNDVSTTFGTGIGKNLQALQTHQKPPQ